ncbi:MAG: hypothetical protein HC836_10660 [Richelia sp. RM2_1_2]|nr:hypothetical protein [Richelia sp. RM2_1_2]
MKRNARVAFNALKKIGAPVFESTDYGFFGISAEDNVDETWADFYEAPRLERFTVPGGKLVWKSGVSPKITDILEANGLHAEWINPGMLGVYE